MLNNPAMGSLWQGNKFVFYSAAQAAEARNCHRNTAAADLKWLVANGFLVRAQLGGEAVKPDGNTVSSANQSWFYRLGSCIPTWFMRLCNAVHSPCDPIAQKPCNQYSKTTLKKTLPKQQPSKAQKPKQPEQPLTRKSDFKGTLQAAGRAMLQAPARALRGFSRTDAEYQALHAKANAAKKQLEDAQWSAPPIGGLEAIRPKSKPVYDRDGFLVASDLNQTTILV